MSSITQKSKFTLPSFLVKLLTILQDSQFKQTICWTQSLDGFQILKLHQFTEKVLPKYFKHQNYSSFVRQLNMYGFTKLKGTQAQNIYQNPLFKKGNRNSLKKIQRKLPIFQQKTQISNKKSSDKKISDEQSKCINNIEFIKKRQSQLQQKFQKVFQNNDKVFNQNMTILNSFSKKPKEQYFIQSLYQMIKTKSKFTNEQFELESVMGRRVQKSIKSEFDKKSKNQQSTVQGTNQQFQNIQEFLQLSQFEELSQFDDLPEFGNDKQESLENRDV